MRTALLALLAPALALLLLLPDAAHGRCHTFRCLMRLEDNDELDTECRRLGRYKTHYCYCCGGVTDYIEFGPVCRRFCRRITRMEGPIQEPCRPIPGVDEDKEDDFKSFPNYPTLRPLEEIFCDARNGGAGIIPHAPPPSASPPVTGAPPREQKEEAGPTTVNYWDRPEQPEEDVKQGEAQVEVQTERPPTRRPQTETDGEDGDEDEDEEGEFMLRGPNPVDLFGPSPDEDQAPAPHPAPQKIPLRFLEAQMDQARRMGVGRREGRSSSAMFFK